MVPSLMTDNRPVVAPVGADNRAIHMEHLEYSSLRAYSLSFEAVSFPEGTSIPGSPDLILNRGVLANMDISGDGVIIQSGDLDEEGFGFTFEEAAIDFLTSLRDRLDSLARRAERLAPDERTLLERLRGLISSREP